MYVFPSGFDDMCRFCRCARRKRAISTQVSGSPPSPGPLPRGLEPQRRTSSLVPTWVCTERKERLRNLPERAHITLRTGALASGALYVLVRIWEALLDSFGALLGSLGALLGSLGASWRPCAPWVKGLGCLWPSWGPLGSLLRASSPLRALFGASVGLLRRLLGPSLGPLGALLGRLGAFLGANWAVLGRSLGPLGPSWAVLGPKSREP